MEFGAFVELEPGVEGLIHISSCRQRECAVADIVKPEQEVESASSRSSPRIKKIALSLLPDPRKTPVAEEPEAENADETPPPPKPERKIPSRGPGGP